MKPIEKIIASAMTTYKKAVIWNDQINKIEKKNRKRQMPFLFFN